MTSEAVQKREISLGDQFGDASVSANGVRVEFHADGSVVVETKGPVSIKTPANDAGDTKERAPPQPGDVMPDGTIYAGISPDTGMPMYAMPQDAPLTYTFDQAREYASAMETHGHTDWRLPSKTELDVLFQNRQRGALKGTFNEQGDFVTVWYWSSTNSLPDHATIERFSDGKRSAEWKASIASVRLVRGRVVPDQQGSSLRCVRSGA